MAELALWVIRETVDLKYSGLKAQVWWEHTEEGDELNISRLSPGGGFVVVRGLKLPTTWQEVSALIMNQLPIHFDIQIRDYMASMVVDAVRKMIGQQFTITVPEI